MTFCQLDTSVSCETTDTRSWPWMDYVHGYKSRRQLNPLIATLKLQSNVLSIQWQVHWPVMGGLLHLVQREGDWAGPSTAIVPTSYY